MLACAHLLFAENLTLVEIYADHWILIDVLLLIILAAFIYYGYRGASILLFLYFLAGVFIYSGLYFLEPEQSSFVALAALDFMLASIAFHNMRRHLRAVKKELAEKGEKTRIWLWVIISISIILLVGFLALAAYGFLIISGKVPDEKSIPQKKFRPMC